MYLTKNIKIIILLLLLLLLYITETDDLCVFVLVRELLSKQSKKLGECVDIYELVCVYVYVYMCMCVGAMCVCVRSATCSLFLDRQKRIIPRCKLREVVISGLVHFQRDAANEQSTKSQYEIL
jgi:hypothetical protein